MIHAEIFWLRDDPVRVLDDFTAALPSPEKSELASFRHSERQRSFILSRTLLRHVLAPRLGINKSAIRFSRSSSGRLALANKNSWQFSVSHGRGLVAVMVAQAACGVDIEMTRPTGFERIARRYFSDAENTWLLQCDASARERHFFRLWTLKEASVKALHKGLANNMARLAFDLSAAEPRLIDPASGLQVLQPVSDGIFLAGAVRTDSKVRWHVQEVLLSDV